MEHSSINVSKRGGYNLISAMICNASVTIKEEGIKLIDQTSTKTIIRISVPFTSTKRNDAQHELHSSVIAHQRQQASGRKCQNDRPIINTGNKVLTHYLPAFEHTAIPSKLPFPLCCREGTTVWTTSTISPLTKNTS